MRALTWTAYLLMACQGYLIYVIGLITPYVREDLGVPTWAAALPNSAMAIGLLAGGAIAGRVNERIGPRYAVRAWAGTMAAAGVLLAIPVSMAPILVGAFIFGVSVGGILVHVNSALGIGPRGGTLLTRANVWSVVGSLAGPLIIAAAAISVGWWLATLVPIPLLVALMFVLPASPARDRPAASSDAGGRLPHLYWMTWLFLALSVGAEFSFVVWGSQVVVAQAGISVVEGTRLASLYVLGMITGRLALSAGLGLRSRSIIVLRGGAALAVAGAAVTWLATEPAVAGLGLLLGGWGCRRSFRWAPAWPSPTRPGRRSGRARASRPHRAWQSCVRRSASGSWPAPWASRPRG